MRCQVAIIGGGPSGLLLSHILHRSNIDTVVLERHSRAHVLARIRAGVLEQGLTNILRREGCGERLEREGQIHTGIEIAFGDQNFRIAFDQLTDGKSVTVYGQTEITRDLYEARDRVGGVVITEASDVLPNDYAHDQPYVTFRKNGVHRRIDCDMIVGCDGFHGVCRQSLPTRAVSAYERMYPFGWLGVLSKTTPVSAEIAYIRGDRGFALCSLRSPELSRYYIQCSLDDRVDAWSDVRFWDELKRRLPPQLAETLVTGTSIEKSIAPLRSFVAEPMRFGRLFLAGDAAHIVPPTGAKGLNLAASDVHYLSCALIEYFEERSDTGINHYSDMALARIWKSERFSWWMTKLLHDFPDLDRFEQRMQLTELEYLQQSRAAQSVFAENYVGLPY